MDAVQIATSVLTLAAGVGVFLIACTMLSSNLESLGSGKLKAMFAKTSKSKLFGVGIGAAATAAIQSSSATTVMVIGFVNAGIMTLTQAATVIFGANIGTTITGQLVALGMFGENTISTSVIFASLAGVGAFIVAFAKKDFLQKIGGILSGFGLLFVGLSMMSGSMSEFSKQEPVKNFLAIFTNPFLLVLIGAILTAIVQSSSVMTSMAITMVVTGLTSLNQGVYITMGSNIGTCVTALFAGMTGTKNGKRAALIHLLFNISGVAVFLIIGLFMQLGGVDYGFLFSHMFPNAPQIQLSMFHTIFNVTTVIIVLPLTNLLVKFVCFLTPDKKNTPEHSDEPHFYFVEEHMLKTPPIAVQQTKKEILNMAETAIRNFAIACNVVCTLNFDNVKTFRANEKQLNYINNRLAVFIAKLMKAELSETDRVYLSTAFRTIIDLERVGDYAENIIEYAEKLKEYGGKFSDDAVKEIKELKELINNLYIQVIKAYKDSDKKALKEAYIIEDRVDKITAEMTEKHVQRLHEGKCTPEVGTQYLSLATNAERVADHFINVANSVKSLV